MRKANFKTIAAGIITAAVTVTAVPFNVLASDVIKVGAIDPTTGDNANGGLDDLHGKELAVKDFNEAGGVTIDGTDYQIELVWKDDTWSASVQNGDQTARLTTKQACTVAAILAANQVMPMKDNETAWPEDAGNVTPMGTCMVTDNDVNVRPAPSTNGNALMTMLESSAVAVSGQTENGWYQIVYNDQFAYMSADYLKAAE